MNKELLIDIKKEIESKAKFWNQNTFFLIWGFSSSIFAMTGIEIFRIIAKDYQFKLLEFFKKLIFYPNDFYLIGILLFFIVFGTIMSKVGKRIDKETQHYNKMLTWINEELKK